jgi:hypothetical protein
MPGNVPPPRVVVAMAEQWPRALLRAALLEAGYDAVGARSVAEALAQGRGDPERDPIKLLVVDRPVLVGAERFLEELVSLHGRPICLLVAPAGEVAPEGPWREVLRRPVSIGEIVEAVRRHLPLASTGSGSIE